MLATGSPVNEGEVGEPGQAVYAVGQVIAGGVSHIAHSIVIVKEPVVLLLQLSVAV